MPGTTIRGEELEKLLARIRTERCENAEGVLGELFAIATEGGAAE